MIVIHGTYRSRATRPVWLLLEAGVPFELRRVWQAYRTDAPEGEEAPENTRSASFLALNPMGSIPVLTDGGLVLTESMAIALHLARTVGGGLGPRDGAEDARMQAWGFFAATSVEEDALAIRGVYDRGQDATEEGRAEAGRRAEALRRRFGALEARLAREPFAEGGRFTVADILVAETVRYAQGHAAALEPFPALDAWLRAAQARPAFQRMWAEREREPLRP